MTQNLQNHIIFKKKKNCITLFGETSSSIFKQLGLHLPKFALGKLLLSAKIREPFWNAQKSFQGACHVF
jgi:hypothetical protein